MGSDLGPAESYLNIERIIDVQQKRADAIGCLVLFGYRFLSENERSHRCAEEGIKFIHYNLQHFTICLEIKVKLITTAIKADYQLFLIQQSNIK